MYEAFTDYLDSLYWSGYTEELAFSNPDAFYFEFANFYKLQCG